MVIDTVVDPTEIMIQTETTIMDLLLPGEIIQEVVVIVIGQTITTMEEEEIDLDKVEIIIKETKVAIGEIILMILTAIISLPHGIKVTITITKREDLMVGITEMTLDKTTIKIEELPMKTEIDTTELLIIN